MRPHQGLPVPGRPLFCYDVVMSSLKARRPRFARAKASMPAIRITKRDLEILRLAAEHRFIRSSHLLSLLGGSRANLLRRLQGLYHHGYLDRPRCQIDYFHEGGSKPIAYRLAGRGAGRLRRDLDMSFRLVEWDSPLRTPKDPGRTFLDHALLVTDFMVAVELACRKEPGLRLLQADELPADRPATCRRPVKWSVQISGRRRIGVVPDRVFGLEFDDDKKPKTRIWYFLEADRGTMPVVRSRPEQTSIHRKLVTYAETWSQNLHRRELGISRFRVLTVTSSIHRVSNIAEEAKRMNRARGLFLFTDAASFISCGDALAHKWRTLGGTATLIADTPHSLPPTSASERAHQPV